MRDEIALARIRAFKLLFQARRTGLSREEYSIFLRLLKFLSEKT